MRRGAIGARTLSSPDNVADDDAEADGDDKTIERRTGAVGGSAGEERTERNGAVKPDDDAEETETERAVGAERAGGAKGNIGS